MRLAQCLNAVFKEGGVAWQGGENICKILLQLGYLGSLAQRKMALQMDWPEWRRFLEIRSQKSIKSYKLIDYMIMTKLLGVVDVLILWASNFPLCRVAYVTS